MIKALMIGEAVCIVLMLLGWITYRWEILSFRLAFGSFALAFMACIAIGLVAIVCFFLTFGVLSESIRVPSLVIGLVGLIPHLIVVSMVGFKGFQAPPIHDISTDLVNIPLFVNAQSLRSESENSLAPPSLDVVADQRKHYGDIAPLVSDMGAVEAFEHSLKVIDELGWTVSYKNRQNRIIEAIVETKVFGFKDDVVIRINTVDGASKIDMRSVSRVGVSDLGANAKRIRLFQQAFQADPLHVAEQAHTPSS